MKNLAAYTLIELLIVISITFIVFSVGISGYREFSRKQTLLGNAKKISSDLRLLQQMALSGEKPEGCQSLNGYQFNPSSGNYNLEALCPNVILIKQIDLSSLDLSVSSSVDPIIFKVLGQGTNLQENAVITVSNTITGKFVQIIVGVGGDIK